MDSYLKITCCRVCNAGQRRYVTLSRKGQKNAPFWLENDSCWGMYSQRRIAYTELDYLLSLQLRVNENTESCGKACFVVNPCSCVSCFLSSFPSCLELCEPETESVTAEHFSRAADCLSLFRGPCLQEQALSELQET